MRSAIFLAFLIGGPLCYSQEVSTLEEEAAGPEQADTLPVAALR
jgi:hypothetical protein